MIVSHTVTTDPAEKEITMTDSVLITGAGSGMGQLAARKLAKQGFQVAALDVNEKGLLETAEGTQNIRTFQTDVTDFQAVQDAVNETEAKLGPIKRVYNAAAIMPLGKIVDQEPEVFQRVMDINFGGVVNTTKAALPAMLARNEGELINFASIAGWLPTVYMAAYDASKFAVVAFTEVLYHEHLDSKVKIACVCPPPVKTQSGPKFSIQVSILKPRMCLPQLINHLKKMSCLSFQARAPKTSGGSDVFFLVYSGRTF